MLAYKYMNTAIHKLNPYCTVVWLGGILILSMIFDDPVYLMLLFLSTLPVVMLARVEERWLSFMKFTLFLCLMIVGLNALFSSAGEHVIWMASFQIPMIGYPTITFEGIIFGLGMSIRLVAIISAFAILILTVDPDVFMAQMVKLKIPYKSVLVISLSTKFFPTLLKDVETLSDVQRARGVELDKGNIFKKVRNRAPMIITLLSNSLERAVQVAEAMEARAFGTDKKRSFYKDVKMSGVDYLLLASALAPLVFGIIVRLLSYGSYQYYPALQQLNISGLEVGALVILYALLVLPAAFSVSLGGRILIDKI
jgi:energy-coupling factor transport system permease protein